MGSPCLLIPVYTHGLPGWDMSGLSDGILLKYQSRQVRIIYELGVSEKIRQEFFYSLLSLLQTYSTSHLITYHNYCLPLEISPASRPLE